MSKWNKMANIEQRLSNIEQILQMAGIATKEILTFEEAAQFTGLSKSTLYKLTSGRKVPHYKPSGKLCYFNRGELQTWLLQNRISTTDEISSQAQAFCLKKGGKR